MMMNAYLNYKPHILMILAQIGYTFLYIITEASFNQGMNPYVYVTYRHLVGGLVLLPFAYFLEKKTRPKLTFNLFVEFFLLALVGVSITLNLFFKGMKYTSPTFLACVVNTVASLTFIIAITLRLEIVKVRSLRGMAKILGVVVSLAGVMTITLYKGPALKNIGHALIHMKGSSVIVEGNWLKGSILTVVSCITWAMWYIMQAYSLKRYPSQLSLATWMNLIGAAQSAVFTVVIGTDKSAWNLGFDIDLWSVLYSGIVVSGFVTFAQLYCTEVQGPVFVTMFNPLSTVLVAVLSYFALGEKLYVGSIIGGVIVVIGLYLLLWGKEKDGAAEIELKETKDPKALLFTADHENQIGNSI